MKPGERFNPYKRFRKPTQGNPKRTPQHERARGRRARPCASSRTWWERICGSWADEEDGERLIEQGERRGAIYTRAESRLVTRIRDPEIVKQVHAFKREFNTRVLPPDHGK